MAALGTPSCRRGEGPFLAVCRARSGPNDRDESELGDAPVHATSRAWASRGIAVLRYDKRTLTFHGRLSPARPNFMAKRRRRSTMRSLRWRLLREPRACGPTGVYVAGHSLLRDARVAHRRADPRLGGPIVLAGGAAA